ncbi:MAG TPA: glycosyl hydrolase, partial [Thermoanaerobaculia bacterium]|nr:glycosyl hydrolase [Thermoanaerobaculia bacterium]
MRRSSRSMMVVLTTLALVVALALPAFASTASATEKAKGPFANLKFRNIGPAVAGGRVSSVAGVPGDPSVYYVGAAAGGVWKTTDGGAHWKAIFEHQPIASIGAIALAPSNPNLVWVGTGEANPRNDIADGHGVYFSPDGGLTWKFMGLADAGQIGRIVVDPANPDIVFVAALGHPWVPNAERGIFRTTDGGKTWSKVLYVDDKTGGSDIAFEPGNPHVLFASMWQVRRYPWELVDGGPGSGLYRSTDGGATWTKLTKGLPEGPLGRIAIALAPTDPEHVYALIEAKTGLLWESHDLGSHWKAVSDNHDLDVRPFYFSQIQVAPDNENRVYFLSFKMLVSNDGGRTTKWADQGVHVDHHALWIDPTNGKRMIQGNDGGVFLSTDGAKTWRFLDNLPIEQFYMVAADSHTPYNLCGGLQDNSAWCGPSSALGGRSVDGSRWFTVAGGDGEYAVPAPSDPDIVYAEAQNGSLERLDLKTHRSRYIRPYLDGVEGMKPADLKYRFSWTTPIAVSPTDANVVYMGANVLFKTADGGKSWEVISPDLTRNDKSKQVVSGGPIQYDISGAETYDTIQSITVSSSDPQVLWVGSDDGLVHVTRDGGKTWKNVTGAIPHAPAWARVYQLGVSPFDPGTAYVAFDGHMLGDRHPHVYRTTNYGASWTSISAGLPQDAPVYVVREDPERRGLLVAGTDTGLFFSLDSGDHWKRFGANFPTAPVWDLKFVAPSHDLVVATHGRGLFVFDDLRPIEEWSPKVEDADFHLFTARGGTLLHHWRSAGKGSLYSAPNAPEGVVIDYDIKKGIEATPGEKKKHQGPVKITVTDAAGNPVATEHAGAKAGVNRFVWGMHYDGAKELDFEAKPDLGAFSFFFQNHGPLVAPGKYNVTVSVGDHKSSQVVEVSADPNLKVDPAVFAQQIKPALEARNDLTALNTMLNRIVSLNKQIEHVHALVDSDKAKAGDLKSALDQLDPLHKKLESLEESVYNTKVQHAVIEDDIHYLARFHDQLSNLAGDMGSGYAQPPRDIELARKAELEKR